MLRLRTCRFTDVASVPSARLLSDSFDVSSPLELALAEGPEATRHRGATAWNETLAEGGGDGELSADTGDSALAFAVGLLAGFGLGHFLVAHESARGAIWLIVDGAVLGSMVLFLDLAFPLGMVFLIGFLAERVLQGLDAMAAVSSEGFRFGEAPALENGGRFAKTPLPFTPNVLSIGF